MSNLPRVIISRLSVCGKASAPAFSTSCQKLGERDWQVATLADGTIACWHPKKEFPYELSRPIDPKALEDSRKALKQIEINRRNVAQLKPYGAEGPQNPFLQEILATGKTEFKTRTREERLYATAAPLPTRRSKKNPNY